MRLPSEPRVHSQRHTIAGGNANAAAKCDGSLLRSIRIRRELLASLKPSAADHHEWGDRARTAAARSEEIEGSVTGQYQMAVVGSGDIDELWPDRNAPAQVPAAGAADHGFADD